MRRLLSLVSFLIIAISTFGQQNAQWYNVSGFAPSVKQCLICPTPDRLYIYVDTGNKSFNFWIEEPERTALLVTVENNDDFEMRRALFDKCIIEYLNNLPANTTIRELTQQSQTNQSQATRREAQQSEQQHINEDFADCQNNQDGSISNENQGNDGQQLSVAQAQQSENNAQEQAENSMVEALLKYILVFLFCFWIIKKLFKGLFSTSKKSDTDKLYEDGAWFHDHK